jgi:hypothetical protein
MFIESVPNRDSPPAVLLRESYRDENGRSQKRTLANLSKVPLEVVEGLKALLKGGTVIGTGPGELAIERSLPHGHVAAALGMIRRIALDRLILSTTKDAISRRHRDFVVAMIVDRLIEPRSKLGFVRAVDEETAISSLGTVLDLGRVKEREAYQALDWVVERQARIESGLARRHQWRRCRGHRRDIQTASEHNRTAENACVKLLVWLGIGSSSSTHLANIEKQTIPISVTRFAYRKEMNG